MKIRLLLTKLCRRLGYVPREQYIELESAYYLLTQQCYQRTLELNKFYETLSKPVVKDLGTLSIKESFETQAYRLRWDLPSQSFAVVLAKQEIQDLYNSQGMKRYIVQHMLNGARPWLEKMVNQLFDKESKNV